MKLFAPLLAATIFLLPSYVSPAAAQEGLNLPPEGQTIINFSASERRSMPQDLLVASLRIEAVDKTDPVAVQKEINEAMTKALEIVKKESSFKVSTGSYSVYRNEFQTIINEKTGEAKTESEWRGSQTLDIESKDSAKLLEAVGKIQNLGFAMNNLGYTLSAELLEKTQDELMVLALKKLQNKAAVVAKTLGKEKVDLVDVNIDMGGPFIPAYKTMMARSEGYAADAMAPPPVADAGETDVTMTVSARALIK